MTAHKVRIYGERKQFQHGENTNTKDYHEASTYGFLTPSRN